MYTVSIPTVITNGHFNKETTLKELKRAKADRVMLALSRDLPYHFTSPENLALLKELIAYYKENGLDTCVWLGETFGHSGDIVGQEPYTLVRHITGEDIGCYCPLDPLFRKDFAAWVQDVARCGADMIMLDDDFRLSYRGSIGCACDLHLAALNALLGKELTLDEIREKVANGGPNEVRSAWMKVQGDSMCAFASEMRAALNEVNPDCRLSFCTCLDVWDTNSADAYDIVRCFAGNTKPFLRTIGAPYWVKVWGDRPTIGEICEIQRNQGYWLKDSGIEFFSECDGYPRPRFATPAALHECYDMILRADGSFDGILKYMLDYVSDATYETGYIDAHVRNQPIYEAIERMFKGGTVEGVMPFVARRQFEQAVLEKTENENIDQIQNTIRSAVFRFATENSLSTAYDDDCIKLVFGESARSANSKGWIIDAPAAKILIERGIDIGVQSFVQADDHQAQNFNDVPVEYYPGENEYTRLAGGVQPVAYVPKDGAEVLTAFDYGGKRANGILRYENADGQRFLFIPYDMEKARTLAGWLPGYARRRLINSNLEWLGFGKKPSAFLDSNHPRLYLLVKRFEDHLAIGVWNLFEDVAYDIKLRLGDEWHDVNVFGGNAHLEGDALVFNTPIQPYACSLVELR